MTAAARAKTGPARTEISFEVYAKKGDRWLVEDVVHEQKQALELAKRLAERPGLQAVRVVREIYDPGRGEALERVIFDTTVPLPIPPPPQPRPEPQPKARLPEPEIAPRDRIRPRPEPFPWLVATCSGVGLVVAVSLLIIRF